MTAPSSNLRDILARENYVYDENPLRTLTALLAGAHDHRVDVDNTKSKRVTRSTALVALNQLNPAVGRGLHAAGVNWNDYCHEVALDDPIKPKKVEDVELHEDFERALMLFSKSHPERRSATPENIALAIIEMAATEKTGSVGDRLKNAGADLHLLPQKFLKAMEAEESEDADEVASEDAKDGEGKRPTVWLLHYKDEDRPASGLMQNDPGSGIEWRSTKKIDAIQAEDPVIYWQDINKKTGNRGGLVGTGRFVGGISKSEETFDKEKNKTIIWHYYPTRFEELFPDSLLARDPLIKETGLEMNWGFGSILKVPPQLSDNVNDYLISHGRKGLFSRRRSDAAPEIVFIGDAPKTDQDFLKRSDLAFVLAARLNRVWYEINPETEDSKGTEQGSQFVNPIRRIFRRPLWTGLFRRQKRTAFENSFVVHIDAPWGGGKTTFANFLIRILNPYSVVGTPPDWFADLPFHDSRFWPEEFLRPWHVVSFNAWQHQHLDPPWWCFYQSIRRQCFHSVRTETFAAKRVQHYEISSQNRQPDAKIPPTPSPKFHFHRQFIHNIKWLSLWVRELFWRIFNPKVKTLIFTFFLTLAAALILNQYGLFKPEALKNALSEGLRNITNLPTVVATVLVIFLGGASAIWSVLAALTESLLPGTPNAAKNYSLGSGDPLERFRIHFDRTARSLKRPILVVVDDIDRCEPRFVVEMLRGIQTILRSSRVIFVLLGDRDWIEQSFANVHTAMKGIDVGAEHTFGGRFVEKTIQLSLVLPDITHEGRTNYVRRLLGIANEVAQQGVEAFPEDERRNIEEKLNDILDAPDPLSRDDMAQSLRKTINANEKLDRPNRKAFVKRIDRQLALRSSSDQRVKQATQHRLVPIAPVLPANPRQIKRIINGIALFQEIARIEQEIQPGSADWCKLALWVVIMTEWPKTWATLSTYPGLVDRIRTSDESSANVLPDDQLTRVWVNAIQKNKAIMRLLDFSSDEGHWAKARINASTIEQFRAFMPATGGELLPESAEMARM